MTRLFWSIAFFVAPFWLSTSVASPQSARYWHVADGVAHTSIVLPEAKRPNTRATLTIEYSVVAGKCRVMVGVAILVGTGYGSPEGTGKPEGLMKVTIPGMHEWSARPVVAMYSNGFEASIPASAKFVDELKSGNIVHVHPMPSAPIFEFSLSGSATAIHSASRACG